MGTSSDAIFLGLLFSFLLFASRTAFGDCKIKSLQNATYSKEWNGYYSVHQATTWDVARFICEKAGAVLATPYTVSHTKFLQKVIKNFRMTCGMYVGARRTNLKAQYFTLEGAPICQIPHRFAGNKPDLNVAETCLYMFPNGTLADSSCMDYLPYVCFRKSVPCNSCYNLCKSSDPGANLTKLRSNITSAKFSYKFDQRTASCYKFHPNATDWGSAVQICANEGGHLAIVNSDVESKVLKEFFARYSPEKIYGATHSQVALVGFHDLFKKNCWRNIDGMSLRGSGFSSWAPGQPNRGAQDEDCGSINRNGLLQEIDCKDKAAFICEINTAPEGI